MKKAVFGLVSVGVLAVALQGLARAEVCANGIDLPDCSVDAETKNPCAPDYTVYSIPLETNLKAGGAVTAVGAGSVLPKSPQAGAADLSAIFLVDTTRLGAEVGANLGTDVTGLGGYGGGKITLSMRHNVRADECSHNWWGVDVDLSGRYSHLPGMESYFSGKIPVYIGQFYQVNNQCTLQIYERGGVAVFDNRMDVPDPSWHDRLLKPFVGAKGVFRCHEGINVVVVNQNRLTQSLELTVDHLFDLGGPDTDVANLDYNKTWDYDTKRFGNIRIGLYSGIEYDYERASEPNPARSIGLIRGGVQIIR